MKELFVFRHGETDWNAEGRFQGHSNIPLNEKGRGQARELAARFGLPPYRGLDVILSSDLDRAHETASIVAAQLGVIVYTDAALREAHLGDAQGLTYEQIQGRFGVQLFDQWRSDHPQDADISYPNGETGNAILLRVFSALEEFCLKTPCEKIGISSHGGVIRRVMQKLRPPGSSPVRIPNTVIYRIHFDPASRHWSLPEGQF